MKKAVFRWAEKPALFLLLFFFMPLLMKSYGLDFDFPATWWRDHPFDYTNMLHLKDTFSLNTRFWGYDPFHLFGWTPHVFYNPLATGLAALFCWPFGYSETGYRWWLYALTALSALAPLFFLPRGLDTKIKLPIWFFSALLALLVFPNDVGIIDANPVQIFYTGQWAQRLGIFWGMAALTLFWRSLSEKENAGRRALWAGAAAGAALFSHYMSGYATFCLLGLAVLWTTAAQFLQTKKIRLGSWVYFGVALSACVLLFFDFFYMYFSLKEYHSLPLLEWELPQGAYLTVREPFLALIPLLGLVLWRLRNCGFSQPDVRREVIYTFLVWLIALLAPEKLLPAALLVVLVLSLWAGREKRDAMYFLPVAAMLLWLLACGPKSLEFGGLKLWKLLPFAGELGWAKFAAYARFLWFAWMGLLAAQALKNFSRRALFAATAFLFLTLALPYGLSLAGEKNSLQFLRWMSNTDRKRTEALLERMRQAARQTPADGYLLVEDTLHHGEDSLLGGDERLPFGHLPYLIGPQVGRPVFGGEVTTRFVSAPLVQTSSARLNCARADERSLFFNALDGLRSQSIAGLLVHSREFIEALSAYPNARLASREAGMTLFLLEPFSPVVFHSSAGSPAGVIVGWSKNGLEIAGFGSWVAGLRLTFLPTLTCRSTDIQCIIKKGSQQIIPSSCFQGVLDTLGSNLLWTELWATNGSSGSVFLSLHNEAPFWPLSVSLFSLVALVVWLMFRYLRFWRRFECSDDSP